MALVVTAVHLGYDFDCNMVLFYQCLEFFLFRVSAASVLLHLLMLQESKIIKLDNSYAIDVNSTLLETC